MLRMDKYSHRPKLGKYRLLKTIGEGNYSTVKLAEHTETNERYAIKIHKEEGLSREDIEDILKEVRAIVKLHSH
jgi:serine/threonine protein kinase